MLLQPGQTLGPYEIKRFLANGGMAEVYLATASELHRDVAVKVLYPHLAADEVFVARFRREGQALASLQHRHIAEVIDTNISNGMHYLVMAYLSGGTLGGLLKRTHDADETLPIDRALEIIRQIAAALEFAHSKGIVHRDLKPGNVMIADDGRFVLSDFGLAQAQASTRLTRTSTVMGTAEYMSPEQALGKELDHRSDIYSLGVILYELLAGKPPYTSSDPMSLMYKHVHEAPPPLTQHRANLPSNIMAVVEKAMAKLPANRFQTVNEFVAALSNKQGTGPKRSSAKTALAIGGALTAVFAGGGILLFAGLNRNSGDVATPAAASPTLTVASATIAPTVANVVTLVPASIPTAPPTPTIKPSNTPELTLNAPTPVLIVPSVTPQINAVPTIVLEATRAPQPTTVPPTAIPPAAPPPTRVPPTATRIPPTAVPPTAIPPATAVPQPQPTATPQPQPTSPPAAQPTSPPQQQPTSPPAPQPTRRAIPTQAVREVINE